MLDQDTSYRITLVPLPYIYKKFKYGKPRLGASTLRLHCNLEDSDQDEDYEELLVIGN